MPDPLAAWLLTYLLHSTLLLSGAWLLTRLWRRMPVAWNEALWRTAVLGGFLTATLPHLFGLESAAGRVALPAAPEPAVAEAPLEDPVLIALPPASDTTEALVGPQPEPITVWSVEAPVPSTPRETVPTTVWLGLLWCAGLLLAAVRHMRARRRLHTRLARRHAVDAGPLHDRLTALVSRAGLRRAPRLSAVTGLGSPLAVGVVRPEIVVPARALHELTSAQQDAMLAHELAHIIRRDALWRSVLRVIGTVCFFQPLHVVAKRRLHETAELLCDAWAVDHTGCSRSLAECLTVVAGWVVGAPRTEPAPAMAARGSMLVRRVERLVEHRDFPSASPRARVGACLLSVLPLLSVMIAAPTIAAGAADADAAATDEPALEAPLVPTPEADTLEREIALLESEVATLLALLARIESPPPALTAGAARLEARLGALKSKRAALAEAAHLKEMSR